MHFLKILNRQIGSMFSTFNKLSITILELELFIFIDLKISINFFFFYSFSNKVKCTIISERLVTLYTSRVSIFDIPCFL